MNKHLVLIFYCIDILERNDVGSETNPGGNSFLNGSSGNDVTSVAAATISPIEGDVTLEDGPSSSISRSPVATSGPSTSSNSKKKSDKQESVSPNADLSIEGKTWLSYADLISDSYPAKSRLVYLKAYKLFERFLKSNNQWKPNTVPSDLQVLNYFHYLRHSLKWAPTTLWSTYARINAVMKRVFGVSLKSYTRVSDVLKSYESGHVVKQAGIFSPQQIEDFVSDPELNSKYWLVRKVVCLIGYYGGFRNIELKSLKFENCESDSMGYWFKFARSKQRGRLEPTSICVPRRQLDWIPVASDSSRVGLDFDPASLIDLYLAEVQNDLQCSREELTGDFFRATHGMKGQKFTLLPLGKNTIGRVGVQVATELCLPRPESFTGHCWRRSCGTSASDSGVNVTTLMAMMGWSNPKTAMVYVKKSRMTSLSLSLYLTNVQRRNCSNPFPRSPLEERKVLKESKELPVSLLVNSGSGLKVEDLEVQQATQDLIRDLEVEEEDGGSDIFGADVEDKSLEIVQSDGTLPSFLTSVNVSNNREEQIDSKEIAQSSNCPTGGSNFVPMIDPRMAGILHNLQNSGNVNIHFHFGEEQK